MRRVLAALPIAATVAVDLRRTDRMLRRNGLQAARDRAAQSHREARSTSLSAGELAAVVDRVGHAPLLGATCLRRAIVLHSLLVRTGHPAELRVGGRRTEAGRFEAHAWVELDGRPIGERENLGAIAVFQDTVA
jgi:hypothetical protein